MKEFIEKLKARLRENQACYVHVNEWGGDTEGGFHDETTFDIDHLMAEIDEFAKTFEPGGENDPARLSA